MQKADDIRRQIIFSKANGTEKKYFNNDYTADSRVTGICLEMPRSGYANISDNRICANSDKTF